MRALHPGSVQVQSCLLRVSQIVNKIVVHGFHGPRRASGSTAHSLPLAPAKLCLQMTSSPGFPPLEAVLLLDPWVPNPPVFPTSPSQRPCCVLHTFSWTRLPLLKTHG